MVAVRMCKYKPECVNLFENAKLILKDKSEKELIDYPQQKISYSICYRMGEDKIVFLASYGKVKPNRCFDRAKNDFDDSVLSDELIHVTNEFVFILYKDFVLCSDHNKRNIILNMLHQFNKNFSCNLMCIAKSIDDFIKSVSEIDSISITATNDLFIKDFLNPSWGDDLEAKEAPESTVVKMEFGRALDEKYIRKIYKKLRGPSYISSFDIKGRNADGFISINEESVIAKDIFEFEKEEGYYDIDEIFEKA